MRMQQLQKWTPVHLVGFFTMLIIATLIAGCGSSSGGSGGGGGSAYEGNRSAATITDSNSQTLAATAYDGASVEGPFGSIASVSPQGDSNSDIAGEPTLLTVSRALQVALIKADPAEATSAAANAGAAINLDDPEPIPGSCGGSASISIQADDNSGIFSGSFSFSDFCEDDTILDGSASFSGRFDPDTEELESFTFTFTSLTGTEDDESFRLNGELSITSSGNTETVTMDLLFEDLISDEVVWLSDFRISVTDGIGYEEFSISGRIYHPVHGYVDIETDTPFRVNGVDDNPYQGVMLLTGDQDAQVRLEALSNVQYEVTADLDADGDFEWGPETYNWEDGDN